MAESADKKGGSIMLLDNKNAIITGTNRGMGRAMVEAFAANGANIWAHARKETSEFIDYITQLSQKYHVEIRPIFFELTDYNEMKRIVKEIMSSKIPVDIMINNAGITYNALFQMSTEENLRSQFEVNFFSVFLFTQYISKLMTRNKKGSIVNIASSAGLDGNPGKSVYGASKAAVICMTNSIAAELGTSGIRANCIAPGITETEMLATMPVDVVKDAIETSDLRRGGKPSEIADAAVFLASDLSSYITGQVIRVDGGLK
jgi:3-oxoacyl-[acyl-carrier protein] reductase